MKVLRGWVRPKAAEPMPAKAVDFVMKIQQRISVIAVQITRNTASVIYTKTNCKPKVA
jgi:hypothetical protein